MRRRVGLWMVVLLVTSDQPTRASRRAANTTYDIKRAPGGWHIVQPSRAVPMVVLAVVAMTFAIGSFVGPTGTVVVFVVACAIAFSVVARMSQDPVLIIDEDENDLSRRFCNVVRRVVATRVISFDRRREIRSELASGWLILVKNPSQDALIALESAMTKALHEIDLEEAKIKAADDERIERVAKRLKLKRTGSSSSDS